jgi:anti-sigma regulatory factor (Ser/Thr protein kinase)
VESLTEPHGVLLGVRSDVDYPEGAIDLTEGNVLLLYTDGLIERRDEPIDAGLQRLERITAAAAEFGPSADAVSERLLERLLAGQARTDDVCLVTAWLTADEPALDFDLDPEPSSSRAARARVHDALAKWDGGELVDPVELLVSELVTNAVVHVGADVRLRLERLPAGVRVRVFDAGDDTLSARRRDVPPDSPSGRGLLIVDNVADRWGVERTASGKQVWFELSYRGVARRWRGVRT